MIKIRRIGAFLCCFALVLCLSNHFGLISARAEAKWDTAPIDEEYDIGDTFYVPQRTFTVDGAEVDSQSMVIAPDGTASKKTEIKLDRVGQYTVVYTATHDGKSYVDEVCFKVYDDLYTYTATNTSVSYGKHHTAKTDEGLLVRLTEGDRLNFNQVVDVAALTSSDAWVSFFVTPDKVGAVDFGRICFQFTDINDPEVSIYFSAHLLNWAQETLVRNTVYYQAGINGEKAKGIYQYDGTVATEATGAELGYEGFQSWSLKTSGDKLYSDEQEVSLRIDPETMIVYSNEGMVIDLDSSSYFKSLWEGFPSGKAYLTVWADSYYGETANFCLTKIGNLDLTAEKVMDTEAPTITIDTQYEEQPVAAKGGSYAVPTASAVDVYSGVREVKTSVWYNYHSKNAVLLNVENGRFKTDWIGKYAIVYEASDELGNVATEILWIDSVSELEKPIVELTETARASAFVGDLIKPQAYNCQSYSGDPTVTVYAQKDGETFDMQNGFRPEKEGNYTIVYQVMDAAGQVSTFEHNLNVEMGDRPVLTEDILMPRYMIEGAQYHFPEIHFTDYRTGTPEQKIATGVLIDAAGETQLKAGDTYTPTVNTTGETIQLVFKCENASHEVSLPTIKSWVVDDGRSRIALENYFVGDGFAIERGESIVVTAETEDAEWIFANSQIAEDFQLSLKGIQGKSNFDSLTVTLTDSQDDSCSLSFDLLNTKGALSVRYGNTVRTLNENTDFASENEIIVEYVGGVLSVSNVKIDTKDFGDFSSDNIYCSVRFNGASKGASYALVSMNGHLMNSSNKDSVNARIVVLGQYGGMKDLGTQVTLPAAVAGDVLNPFVDFKMSVRLNSEPIQDINGLVLSEVDPNEAYTILLDNFGQYEIVYTAVEDYSEKTTTLSYIIHVADDESPVLTFSEEFKTEAKVGDVLCIPNFELMDNMTSTENIILCKYVVAPTGVLYSIPNRSNSVTASMAGTYKFMIMATDAEGNVQNVTWSITVSDAN